MNSPSALIILLLTFASGKTAFSVDQLLRLGGVAVKPVLIFSCARAQVFLIAVETAAFRAHHVFSWFLLCILLMYDNFNISGEREETDTQTDKLNIGIVSVVDISVDLGELLSYTLLGSDIFSNQSSNYNACEDVYPCDQTIA